jgi:hypothetical protein
VKKPKRKPRGLPREYGIGDFLDYVGGGKMVRAAKALQAEEKIARQAKLDFEKMSSRGKSVN